MRNLKSYILVILVALASFGLAGNSARAASLTIDGTGQLTGATGIDVNGVFYNVSFVEGTCDSLFNGCDSPLDFAFSNISDVYAAYQALQGQVLTGSYDTDPTLTYGIENTSYGAFWTPYALAGSNNLYAGYLQNNSGLTADSLAATYLNRTLTDSSLFNNYVYADWTQVSAVPLPPSAILFGTALLGLAGLRRRKRKTSPSGDLMSNLQV